MNVEIGGEAALFPEKGYINGIFVAVQPVAPGHVCPTTAFAVLSLNMSGVQQPLLRLDVSTGPCAAPVCVHWCCTWTCLCTRACFNVLHLYVCFYAAPGHKSLCCICKRLSSRALCFTWISGYVYLQDPMLQLDCFGCLNTALKHWNKPKKSYLVS